MGAASTLERPTNNAVEVTPSAVKATGVSASVTNGCVFLTLPDESAFATFKAGLDQKGVLYTVTDALTIRFYARNNH
jgi:hypothetical protein